MKYLSGLLVGNQMVAEKSSNHLVGVVGSHPIPETYRHINAFIRGCVEADPLCRVAVVWTMTWNDTYIERWAAMKLWVEEGARGILQGARVLLERRYSFYRLPFIHRYSTGTDSIEPQLVFGANGPAACADRMIHYDESRGCLDPDEVAATRRIIPGNGFGIGYNSDMRQVSSAAVPRKPNLEH